MKEYLLLYKSKLNNYCNLEKHPKSKLLDLFIFFSEDYSSSKIDIFTKELTLNNTTYVYNDFKNKMMYIGFGEWFIDEDIDSPSWDEYSSYVNENNSCKISVHNFIEFAKKWVQLRQSLFHYVLFYRDDNDWIDCKGFQSQEAMQLFMNDQVKQTEKTSSFIKIGVRDPEELDQMHAAIPYSIKINNFLEVIKPSFSDKNGKIYYIEGFSSIQIHAGTYSVMNRPRGGHSNFGAHKLDYFNPLAVKIGYLNSKDMLLRNSRFPNLTKFSYVYPESWSEYLCDLKAIEALMDDEVQILPSNIVGILKVVGYTSENLEIIIFYEIQRKIIRMHYPNIE